MNTILLRRSLSNLSFFTPTNSAFFSSPKFPPFPFFCTTSIRSLSPESPFLVEYLIRSVGLLPKDAIRVSKSIAHIKSLSKPDCVLKFFKQSGFSDSNIKKIVCARPCILRANVESTLNPKMKALLELGFTQSEAVKLFSAAPFFLFIKEIRPKIEFFKALFRSNENLIKAVSGNNILLGSSIERKIKPNISFLKELQLSDHQTMFLNRRCEGFITRNIKFLKIVVNRVKELGFVPGTRMFFNALFDLSKVSENQFHDKCDLLKSFGCSEVEIISVIRKVPRLTVISRIKLQDKADFLVKEAGLKLSYLIAHPVLLCYSLEKRLIPRINVLLLLRANRLLQREVSLVNAIQISDKKFMECFIFPSEKKMPMLHETFLAACAGNLEN
ncbi:hypothetical protein AXF42_Ash002973 [Apostasia shenzhenica]|uniref:Uncharacterized protein n=1 Tax=Apostasia shenzhenica TaxID=1088818 RepID=A0A2I0A7U4_9ASPA|nr:hypothetical protein AXF42_Ash002973 [Apostasia shenzhenica]